MVTTPEKVAPEPTKLERSLRVAIAGHPAGAVRRIVLYLIVVVAVGASPWPIWAVGLAGLFLLAMTDELA